MINKPLERNYVNGLYGAILCSWIAVTWFGLMIVDGIYYGEISNALTDRFMREKGSVPLGEYRTELWQMVFLAHLLVTLYITLALIWRHRSARQILTVLLVGDLIIIAGSAIFGGEFRVWREPNIPEFWQNSKELFTAITFYWLWRNRNSSLIFAAFAVLFLWIFADDAFKYHERAGDFLSANFDFSAYIFYEGLREEDIGELLSLLLPVTLIFPFIGYAYFKSDQTHRHIAHVVLGLVAALGFFGVFVDMLDQYTGLGSFSRVVVHLEDGGELIVISAAAAYATSLVWRSDLVK